MISSLTRLPALAVLLCAVALPPAAHAAPPAPAPFAAGDAAAGKALVEADCVACHERKFKGNAGEMYLRADHKVHTPAQLLAQVQRCNTQLDKRYFPEEEAHVAAYLNLHYYKFKP